MPTCTPQHVIWITADHWRYDSIGAHGNPEVHTPNLDALVARGVTFSDCHVNSPVCMPSRASFMTGCYPPQTGVTTNGQTLPQDFEPLGPRYFQRGGFRTVQIGKLHLQPHQDHDLRMEGRNNYGFDVIQLSEEPGCYEDAYRIWLRGEYPELVDRMTVPRPMSDARSTEAFVFNVVDAPWRASHSGFVATQFRRMLERGRRLTQHHFFHLGFYAPHPPLNPTIEMFEPYRDREITPPHDPPAGVDPASYLEYKRHFNAMVTGLDFAIGDIVDALRSAGMLDQTLLVVGSDHGDACGEHGKLGKGPEYFDSITRVPLILHWPEGLGTSPRRVDGLVEMVDVLPSLLEWCGLPIPSAMSGRSLLPMVHEGKAGREDVFSYHGRGQCMLRTADWKYLRYPADHAPRGDREVLYDLRRDPEENHNVVNASSHAHVLAELRLRMLDRLTESTLSVRPILLEY